MLELARAIIAISGKQSEIFIASKEMGREYSGNNAKLLDEMFGFKFKNQDNCISRLYKWYQDQKEIQADKLV